MNIKNIAKICHEANRAYCESIGDSSQVPWKLAPDWQRKNIIGGVEFIVNNPDAEPSDSHESWLKDMEADGWKYGPKKNPAKKEHPCFVPYEDLPDAQKVKNYLIKGIVDSLSEFLEEEVQPKD